MTSSESDRFVEVVPAAPFQQADAQFDAWLQESGLTKDAVADDDVRVDTIRTLDGGSQRRYLVRQRLITNRE